MQQETVDQWMDRLSIYAELGRVDDVMRELLAWRDKQGAAMHELYKEAAFPDELDRSGVRDKTRGTWGGWDVRKTYINWMRRMHGDIDALVQDVRNGNETDWLDRFQKFFNTQEWLASNARTFFYDELQEREEYEDNLLGNTSDFQTRFFDAEWSKDGTAPQNGTPIRK